MDWDWTIFRLNLNSILTQSKLNSNPASVNSLNIDVTDFNWICEIYVKT